MERDTAQADLVLPVAPTTFFGRQKEQSELLALLLRDDIRLVTLLGPGGIGKTRLAVAVAQSIQRDHVIEICFADLSQVRAADRMLLVIADVLGLIDTGSESLAAEIARTLVSRTTLLVLDNLEQVAGAAQALGPILERAPGSTILATSRRPLRLRGEHQFPVPPLGLPDPTTDPADDAANDSPAIDLFVDRARMVQPDFRLTEKNREDVRAICERVDGLPLAIELAASRVRLFSPADLLTQLQSHLTLLSRGAIDLPERQQSLQQTIAWSSDLLDENERYVLECCSLFEGSFSTAAAIAVCTPDGRTLPSVSPAQIADILTSLLEQSLLQPVAGSGEGNVRFRLLQTVRDFAKTSLIQRNELDQAQNRYIAYFTEFAAIADPALDGPDQMEWLRQLEAENENLLATLTLLADRQDSDLAVSLVGNLWMFWFRKGYIADGRRWIEQILALPGSVDTAKRAAAYNGLGALSSAQGDHDAAKHACESAVELWRVAGNERSVASCIGNLSNIAEKQGDYAEAMRLSEEALQIFQRLDDRYRSAATISNIAVIAYMMGEFQRAIEFGKRALGIRRALNDSFGIAASLHNLGNVMKDVGDWENAIHYLQEACLLFRELDDPRMLAVSFNQLGSAYRAGGDLVTSDQQYQQSQHITETMGAGPELAAAFHGLGVNASTRGDTAQAMTYYRQSLEMLRSQEDVLSAIPVIERVAIVASSSGEPAIATTLLTFADHYRQTTGYALESLSAQAPEVRAARSAKVDLDAEEIGRTASFGEIVDLALTVDPRPSHRRQPGPTSTPRSRRKLAGPGLTEREIDVLRLVAAGKTNAEIGTALFISPFTAKTHVANLLQKMHVESRAAAAAWAARNGILDQEVPATT